MEALKVNKFCRAYRTGTQAAQPLVCLLKRDKTTRSLFTRQYVYIHQDSCVYSLTAKLVYVHQVLYIHQDMGIYIKIRQRKNLSNVPNVREY